MDEIDPHLLQFVCERERGTFEADDVEAREGLELGLERGVLGKAGRVGRELRELLPELLESAVGGSRPLDHPEVVRKGVKSVGRLRALGNGRVLEPLEVDAGPLQEDSTGKTDHVYEQRGQDLEPVLQGSQPINTRKHDAARDALHAKDRARNP